MISPYDHIIKVSRTLERKPCDGYKCKATSTHLIFYFGRNGDHEFTAQFLCCKAHAKVAVDNCKEFS